MEARVGLLGVGHLAVHLVPGLLRGLPASQVMLSPRNALKSAALAKTHGVTVAGTNAALVGACDLVLLACRPAQAAAAIAGLPWRPGQTLVSLCAGVRLATLAANAGGASLVRAMPITAASIGESPTCLYPDLPAARDLLAPLGPVLAMPDEETFDTACVSAAVYGWVHALIGETAAWAAQAGVPDALARDLTAQTFRAAAAMVRAHPERPVDAMTRELCTAGGITEAGLGRLKERGAFEAWRAACDAALARLK